MLFDLGDTLLPEGTTETLPHIKEVLTELKKQGLKLAVVCNATIAGYEMVKGILTEAGISDFFDAVVVSTEVGYSKLDVRIFQITLRRLGVELHEAIMVGNRITTDILGGNRAGMKTVLLRFTGRYDEKAISELEEPTYTIGSMGELMQIVTSL